MITECCISGFQWDGTPTGKQGKIADNETYIVGTHNKVAILVVAGITTPWTTLLELWPILVHE